MTHRPPLLHLLLALLLTAPLFAQPITLETPLFEGGAGKAWFLYAARAYELQGAWTLPNHTTLEIQLAPPPITPAQDYDLQARLTPATTPVSEHSENPDAPSSIVHPPSSLPSSPTSSWLPVHHDPCDPTGHTWTISSPTLTATLHTDGLTLSATLRPANSPPIHLTATKPHPVSINCTLDPRIEDKIRVRFLEGTFPEFTNALNINYWPLIHNGDVLDLAPYLDAPDWTHDAPWRSTFLPGTLDPYTENHHVYGIPLAYYPYVLWYNKKLFTQNHWPIPTTWQDLFNLCDQIKQSHKAAPIAFQGRYPDYARPLYDHASYHLAGPKRWHERQALVPGAFLDPENIRALALVRQLAQNDFQPGALGMSHTEAQLQFFLGHAAMIPCGAWLKSEMLGKIPEGFQLGCFNLPLPDHPKGDPTALNTHVEPFFVFTHSAHPAEAVDYLRFLTSRRMTARFVRMQDIPAAVAGTTHNLSPDLADLAHLIDRARTSYGPVPSEAYAQMEQVYTDSMYDTIAQYNLSPTQIAEHLESKAAALRTQNQHPTQVLIQHRLAPTILLTLLGIGLLYALYQLLHPLLFRPSSFSLHPSLPRLSPRNTLLFLAPTLLLYSLFLILPSLRSFSWSLHAWNGLTPMQDMPYVGLLHFKRLLFESDAFWIALRNNLFLMFVVPAFVVPLSLLLAAAISRNLFGANFFRVVIFLPNLIGGVAATLLWLHLYNPQGGLVNAVLTHLGFTSFAGYTWLEPKHLNWSLIPISVWGACGFNMILYLAAMESIPESYYEAATLDGASKFRQFFTITLPLIQDILAISAVFLIIGGMKAFEIIWLLTNQRPPTQNHVIATRMVQTMFTEFKVGEAAALAVLLFLMILVGSAATLRFTRRETIEL